MKRQSGKTYWFDLCVGDLTDAMSFYEALFGWTFVRLKDNFLSEYVMIQIGNDLIGGLRQVDSEKLQQKESQGPIVYFTVDKLEPKKQRIKELGGKLIGDQVDLGQDRGSYQWFRDRENNLVALWAEQ